MTQNLTDDPAGEDLGFDPNVPSSARIWNYWVGGKDHFAADRAAAEKVLEAMPTLRDIARVTRQVLAESVRILVEDYGIRQFLDVGTGLPTADNTHQIAQRLVPGSRIVYVDNDPSVLAHARALLTSTPEGSTDYIDADLRDSGAILDGAARTLDFGQPLAILLISILHFIPDSDDPKAVIARLLDAAPAGSFLVIVHAASDIAEDHVAEGVRRYNSAGPAQMHPRTRAEVSRFFDGLDLIGPGVAPMTPWLSGRSDGRSLAGYAGIGRK